MHTKILTTCNHKFVEVAIIWAKQMEKLGLHNYLILAYDSKAYNKLKKRKIKIYLCRNFYEEIK